MSKSSVLDDLDYVGRLDEEGMLSFCVNAAKHYEKAAKIAEKVTFNYMRPQAVIVAGMGGSAIGGELLKDWTRDTLPIPLEVCREYALPAFAGKRTLTFIVSYSGETEEALSVFLSAVKRKGMVACISSGGELLELAKRMRVPTLKIPRGIPPRAALPYLFMPMAIFLEKLGLIPNFKAEISEAITILKQVCSENAPEKPLKENFAKELAFKINGTVPVVYGFGFYRSVAQRFKQQFNENSKIPSKWDAFPELNHNEVVGWEKAAKLAKHFTVVIIRDRREPKEIKCRIEATKELLDNKVAGVYEVWSRGEGKLARMLSTTIIGDFTSVYLALLRGVNPTPVETIVLLKERTAKSGIKDGIIRELRSLTK
ncbi:MAG: bifunctional phosphoglucose/phosphomannose isomerase [Candidatus Bathycorpusculaceae bacterium]